MNGEQLPPQVQDKLNQFRTLQQQLQLISLQKHQLVQRSMETENALKELNKLKGKEKVYRNSGPLFIETSKKDSEKELKEEKSSINARLKVFEKQEQKLSEKLTSLKKKVETLIQGLQGGGEGGVVTRG